MATTAKKTAHFHCPSGGVLMATIVDVRRDLDLSPVEVAAYYRERVPGLKQTSAKEWRGGCPAHGGKGPNFVLDATQAARRSEPPTPGGG